MRKVQRLIALAVVSVFLLAGWQTPAQDNTPRGDASGFKRLQALVRAAQVLDLQWRNYFLATRGHVGLQSWKGRVEFRNLRIKDL